MADDDGFEVEVVYGLPHEQTLLTVRVPPGTTVAEAVERSGIRTRYPDVDPQSTELGIFGKVVKRDRLLRPGDRVEVYRPLKADPKEVRRLRAAEGKALKRGQSGE